MANGNEGVLRLCQYGAENQSTNLAESAPTILMSVQGGGAGKKSRAEFDRFLRDVLLLTLPQAAKREVGGRRTKAE
jgi:hypothetical protein